MTTAACILPTPLQPAFSLGQVLRPLLRFIDPRRHGGSLPRLEQVHRQAGGKARRWRGTYPVPVGLIVGTASAQSATRRRNFLPAAGREPADWKSRWARLEAAAAELRPLPPIDVVKVDDGYWVLDGHNRVALAKRIGQIAIDANVVEIGSGQTAPQHSAPAWSV